MNRELLQLYKCCTLTFKGHHSYGKMHMYIHVFITVSNVFGSVSDTCIACRSDWCVYVLGQSHHNTPECSNMMSEHVQLEANSRNRLNNY